MFRHCQSLFNVVIIKQVSHRVRINHIRRRRIKRNIGPQHRRIPSRILNARLTFEFGAEWTAQFATAHEGSNPGNSTREAMDLYNNQIGRQIAISNPIASPAELADLVKKALDNGDRFVVSSKGHLQDERAVINGQRSKLYFRVAMA